MLLDIFPVFLEKLLLQLAGFNGYGPRKMPGRVILVPAAGLAEAGHVSDGFFDGFGGSGRLWHV